MEEQRAFSRRQFAESGFDTTGYAFNEEQGLHTAVIDCKRWGKHKLVAYLRSIPTYLDIEVAGKRFYMVHGFPGDNVHDEVWTRPTMESENPIPDCRLIIGHTKVLSLIQPEEKRINHALDLESRGEHLNILHAPGFINLDYGCGYDMPIKALTCIRLEDMVEYYT